MIVHKVWMPRWEIVMARICGYALLNDFLHFLTVKKNFGRFLVSHSWKREFHFSETDFFQTQFTPNCFLISGQENPVKLHGWSTKRLYWDSVWKLLRVDSYFRNFFSDLFEPFVYFFWWREGKSNAQRKPQHSGSPQYAALRIFECGLHIFSLWISWLLKGQPTLGKPWQGHRKGRLFGLYEKEIRTSWHFRLSSFLPFLNIALVSIGGHWRLLSAFLLSLLPRREEEIGSFFIPSRRQAHAIGEVTSNVTRLLTTLRLTSY